MYGEAITPNLHKLARQFGALDNFYDSGEVSGDGHLWSTAAITSDYTEMIWPISYRCIPAHAKTMTNGDCDSFPRLLVFRRSVLVSHVVRLYVVAGVVLGFLPPAARRESAHESERMRSGRDRKRPRRAKRGDLRREAA
jgi:hypothetical protein